MKSKYPVKRLIVFNVWLSFYFSLFGFFTTMASSRMEDLHRAILSSIIGAIVMLLITFSNLGLMIFFENKNIKEKSILKAKYLITSNLLSAFVFFSVIIFYGLLTHASIHYSGFLFVFFLSLLVNMLVLALQNYVIIHDAKTKSDVENSQLKAANINAANQLLRQQIHPHFLFNALNILKSLYKVNPKAGEEYLIRLSDFLRASVSTNNIKVIAVKDELKLCEDYLEMQRIRFGNALSYSVLVDNQTRTKGFVPSFSIQPLLENAIKHNEVTVESPLAITISQQDDRIKVSNNLQFKKNSESSTGSGLANLSERYRLLSNDELIIEESPETFSVSIKILSHEDSHN